MTNHRPPMHVKISPSTLPIQYETPRATPTPACVVAMVADYIVDSVGIPGYDLSLVTQVVDPRSVWCTYFAK